MSKSTLQDHQHHGQTEGGLIAGTLVLTLDGALPVEHLEVGDRIITRDGAIRLASVTARRIGAPLATVLSSVPGRAPQAQADRAALRDLRIFELGFDRRRVFYADGIEVISAVPSHSGAAPTPARQASR